MSSVAKGLLFRVLAAAKRDPLSLLELHLDRGKLRSRMGAVAEWLCLGPSTPAPIDHAGPDLHDLGTSLRNDDLIAHAILFKGASGLSLAPPADCIRMSAPK